MALLAPGGTASLGSLDREKPVLPALPWVPGHFRGQRGSFTTLLGCAKGKGGLSLCAAPTFVQAGLRAWHMAERGP